MNSNNFKKAFIIDIPRIFNKSSEKKITIYDEDKNVIGYVNRFYASFIQKFFSCIFDHTAAWTLNVEITDENNNKKVVLRENNKLQTTSWTVSVYSNNEDSYFTLNYKPNFSTLSENYSYEYNNKKISIDVKTIGFKPYFYENKKLIAMCHDRLDLNNTLKIEVYDSSVDIYQILSICYLINFKA